MDYLDSILTVLSMLVAVGTLGGMMQRGHRRIETRTDRLEERLESAMAGARSETGMLRAELTADIAGLDTKIESLRTELTGGITGLRTELTGGITDLRTELTGDITGLDTKIESLRTEFRADFSKLDDRVYVLAARLAPVLEEETPGPAPRGVRKA